NQETVEVKKEDATPDKESNSTEAHSTCPEQSCINDCTQANPASSMCASQLLKLKRQQDDKQHQQHTSPQPAAATTAAATTHVDTVTKITLSKPISAIPTLQPANQNSPSLVVVMRRPPKVGKRCSSDGGENKNCHHILRSLLESSAPVITLPASTPIVTRINPTTATLVPRAMTLLVPAISAPVTTIVRHQAPMVSSPSMPHVQVQRPNVVPATKRAPIRSATTSSAKLPLIPLATTTRVPEVEGDVPTNAPIVQTPTAVSVNRSVRRPTIHKCHTLRKISPKLPPLSSVPSTSTSPSMLKSILESGSRTPEVVSHPSLTATQLPLQGPSNATTFVTTVSQPPVMSTGMRQDNHASSAHRQSRGTWQVGGRAIVLDVSLNRSSNSTASPAPQ
ncbi:unnamed protein product, partial [Hymenolepis diminuta]|uniref:ENT domain-containing protein n=1 Tax=Hymenolepis diminuta TaxID=6216 RepID=A0A0R3SJR9_HYMDI